MEYIFCIQYIFCIEQHVACCYIGKCRCRAAPFVVWTVFCRFLLSFWRVTLAMRKIKALRKLSFSCPHFFIAGKIIKIQLSKSWANGSVATGDHIFFFWKGQLFKETLYCLCMPFLMHASMCTTCVTGTCRSQKGTLTPCIWGLEGWCELPCRLVTNVWCSALLSHLTILQKLNF